MLCPLLFGRWYKLDIKTPHLNQEYTPLTMNDLARILLHASTLLYFKSHKNNLTDCSLLADGRCNMTAAGGMIPKSE